jgi:hypothetical protein
VPVKLCKRFVKHFTEKSLMEFDQFFYLLENSDTMAEKDFLHFKKLKQDLVKKIKTQYPDVSDDISDWKGKEIHFFQQDLEKNAKGRISEKWFYTHFKGESSKLPRIDILDLLSKYLGYAEWSDYCSSNKVKRTGLGKIIGIAFLVFLVLISSFLLFKNRVYSITIVDAYTNKLVDSDKLLVIQLFGDESPQRVNSEKDGSYTFLGRNSEIKFAITAPYYNTDTVFRKLKYMNGHEVIRLFPNDYALMIHYLSNSKSDDWLARRDQLSGIIANNAKIFQVSESGQSIMEIFTKQSFINKLTIPSKGLQNIEILYLGFEGEQISHLRFMQKKGGTNE